MSVTLDHLYTDATSFNKLPSPPGAPKKRVFFVLTYKGPDIKTLSGYPTNPSGSGPFDPDPAIELQKAKDSEIIPGDPIYAGDVVLDADDVKKIKDYIASEGAKFVRFTPGISKDYPNHVEYTVSLTNDDPGLKPKPVIILAGLASLNPSPPKQL